MFSLLKQYTLPIIGGQFVLLLLLGYLLYGSYTQWEEKTEIVRDTTVKVERDTVWRGVDVDFDLEDLEPEREVTEVQRDTVVKDSIVYITETPGVSLYEEDFSKTFLSGNSITGTVTSRVRGTLLDQDVSFSASFPTITEYETRTITETITKTRVGKWRIVGSADVFFGSGDGIHIVAPGVGLQRPTEFSLFYKYDVINGYHGISVNVPITLLF